MEEIEQKLQRISSPHAMLESPIPALDGAWISTPSVQLGGNAAHVSKRIGGRFPGDPRNDQCRLSAWDRLCQLPGEPFLISTEFAERTPKAVRVMHRETSTTDHELKRILKWKRQGAQLCQCLDVLPVTPVLVRGFLGCAGAEPGAHEAGKRRCHHKQDVFGVRVHPVAFFQFDSSRYVMPARATPIFGRGERGALPLRDDDQRDLIGDDVEEPCLLVARTGAEAGVRR